MSMACDYCGGDLRSECHQAVQALDRVQTEFADASRRYEAALAQAERERDEAADLFAKKMHQLVEARAEVERLMDQRDGVEELRQMAAANATGQALRAEHAEAALTRVRAALGITTDGLRELERHFSDTAYPVSTMEHELVLMSPLQKIQDVLKRAALEGAALEGRRCSH